MSDTPIRSSSARTIFGKAIVDNSQKIENIVNNYNFDADAVRSMLGDAFVALSEKIESNGQKVTESMTECLCEIVCCRFVEKVCGFVKDAQFESEQSIKQAAQNNFNKLATRVDDFANDIYNNFQSLNTKFNNVEKALTELAKQSAEREKKTLCRLDSLQASADDTNARMRNVEEMVTEIHGELLHRNQTSSSGSQPEQLHATEKDVTTVQLEKKPTRKTNEPKSSIGTKDSVSNAKGKPTACRILFYLAIAISFALSAFSIIYGIICNVAYGSTNATLLIAFMCVSSALCVVQGILLKVDRKLNCGNALSRASIWLMITSVIISLGGFIGFFVTRSNNIVISIYFILVLCCYLVALLISLCRKNKAVWKLIICTALLVSSVMFVAPKIAYDRPVFTVSVNVNGGQFDGTITVNDDGTITKPSTIPTRDGYRFVGWYKDKACTEEWNFETDKVTANVTIYIKWEKVDDTVRNKYTVTFDTDGGSEIADLTDIVENATITAPTTPTKEGYDFAGWYKDKACTEEWNFETDNITQNTTLYATWTRTSTKGLLFALKSDGKSYSVSGIGTATDTDIVIPAKHENKPVTSINSSAFYNCSNLTSVTIPDSVTTIRDNAFYGCSKLINIIIPNSVIEIGASAFKWCRSLTSVSIPSGVTTICDDAFSYCRSLTSIIIPNGVMSIGANAFYDCVNLTNVTIGNSVTEIGLRAFCGCSNLISVTIPNSVTSIGNMAFRNCTDLTSVTIGNNVTTIGSEAFNYCYKLIEVCNLSALNITAGYSSNGYVARYAQNIYTLTSGSSKLTTTDDGYVFYNAYYTYYLMGYVGSENELTLPENYNDKSYEVYQYAFYGCSNLTSVTIGASVTSIGMNAFDGCSRLTSVTIGNSVKTICAQAFDRCSSLTSITIPNSVTFIGDSAFSQCSSLASVIIGDNVTTIGRCAFYDCTNLTSVTIGASVTTIESGAFANSPKLIEVYNLSELNISVGSLSYGSVAYYAKNVYTSTSVASKLTTTDDGYIFYEDGNATYLMGYVGNQTELTLPGIFKGKAYSIYHHAFYNCSCLASVTIPDGVTSIGTDAFNGCSSLTKITLSNSVASIDNWAFYGCSSLKSITIPNSVASIDHWAFEGCSSLESITVQQGNSRYYSEGNCLIDRVSKTLVLGCKNSVIPTDGSVTSIGQYAFSGCSSLKSITIPNSVASIDHWAFHGCDSLTSVKFINVKNWQVTSSSSQTNPLRLSQSDLTNEQTAAKYLTDTYCDYIWERS